MKIGLSKREFLHTTIKDLQLRIKTYYENEKERTEWELDKIEYETWLTGLYVQRSVASSLSSKCKYPDKPFNFTKKSAQQEHTRIESGKSEEEIKQEQRYYELLIRQANANIANATNVKEG